MCGDLCRESYYNVTRNLPNVCIPGGRAQNRSLFTPVSILTCTDYKINLGKYVFQAVTNRLQNKSNNGSEIKVKLCICYSKTEVG